MPFAPLLVALAAAAPPPPPPPEPVWLSPEIARAEVFLGDRGQRDLERALVRLRLADELAAPSELMGRPAVEEASRTLRNAYVRFFRKGLEDRLLGAWWDRRETARAGEAPRGIDVSPRADLGGHPYLGARVRFPAAESQLWRHLSVQVRGYLDGDGAKVKVGWHHDGRSFELSHRFGSEPEIRIAVRISRF